MAWTLLDHLLCVKRRRRAPVVSARSMTTLDRLGIQGIRSYGPEPEQVLGESLQVLGTRCPPSRAGGAASSGASRSHRRALRPVAAARTARMPGTHLCVTWPFLCGSLCPCVAARRGAVGAAGSPCFADEGASCAGHHLQSAANPDPGTKRQRKDNHHRGTRARCIRLHCKPSRPAACPKPRQKQTLDYGKTEKWLLAVSCCACHCTSEHTADPLPGGEGMQSLRMATCGVLPPNSGMPNLRARERAAGLRWHIAASNRLLHNSGHYVIPDSRERVLRRCPCDCHLTCCAFVSFWCMAGSGQAFVHDPRVSHASSTETKGKIRLRCLLACLCCC